MHARTRAHTHKSSDDLIGKDIPLEQDQAVYRLHKPVAANNRDIEDRLGKKIKVLYRYTFISLSTVY